VTLDGPWTPLVFMISVPSVWVPEIEVSIYCLVVSLSVCFPYLIYY
jgi:hypothetical protein